VIYDEADSSFQQFGQHSNKCYLTVNMWLHSLPKMWLWFWSSSSFFGRHYSFIWGRGVATDDATVISFPFREYIEKKWQLRFKNIIQKKFILRSVFV